MYRMVPYVIDIEIPKLGEQSTLEVSFTDSLQNKWTLHFAFKADFLEISLELKKPITKITPVIGIYHLKSKVKSVLYDFTHLFDESLPKSMEVRVTASLLNELIEMEKLQMKVDIRVMKQVFPIN